MTLSTPLVALVAGAALLALVTRFVVPPATWVALLLLLHASRSMSPGAGALYLWIAMFAAFVLGNRGMVPANGAAYFGIQAMYATTLALPFVVDRLLAFRTAGVASTLMFPLAFVAVEFLRSRFTPAATWGSLAYTQYGYLPLMQIAAFVGIWGISFVLGWTASTIQWAWAGNFAASTVRVPLVAWGAALALIAIGGGIRVALAPTDGRSIRAVTLSRPLDLFVPGEMTQIASGRVSTSERPYFAGKLTRLQDWFLEGSRREARAGAGLVAWAEQNVLVFAEDEPAFLERAQRLAAEEHVYLVMGLGTIYLSTPLPFENKSVIVDPSGRVVASYTKAHPVPGWEGSVMRRGDGRLPVVETHAGRLATAICFDADFPSFIRQAGRDHADLLIVPANEWREIKDVHMHMAAFRAIENGVALVRPAASGLSSAVDPWGRVLGISDHFSAREMTARVPIGHVSTLYTRTGDLFAWLCVAGLVVTIVMAIPRITPLGSIGRGSASDVESPSALSTTAAGAGPAERW